MHRLLREPHKGKKAGKVNILYKKRRTFRQDAEGNLKKFRDWILETNVFLFKNRNRSFPSKTYFFIKEQ
jgi:hypothetical protein